MKIVYAAIVVLLAMAERASAAIPSHCKADEYPVLDAWMGETYATSGGWRSKKDGKLLSLCSDRAVHPFGKITYRYGFLGRVEFEKVGTLETPFKMASISTSPHTGEDLIFFRSGPFTYYVGVATAQGQGVVLQVFKGRKEVAFHFSGNFEGEDFQLGAAGLFPTEDYAGPAALVDEDPEHYDLLR